MDIGVDFEVDPALVPQLVGGVMRGAVKVAGADGVLTAQVPEYHVGVLYVDGRIEKLLAAGMHYFWKFIRELRVETVDLRLQTLDVAGQEILTRDKVSLRVNLTAGYRVTDVLAAYGKQAKPVDYLYKELQFGLRAAVGTRTLDELLENKGGSSGTPGSLAEARCRNSGNCHEPHRFRPRQNVATYRIIRMVAP